MTRIDRFRALCDVVFGIKIQDRCHENKHTGGSVLSRDYYWRRLCRGRRGDQALQGRQHLLRQGELDGDRVDLGHGEQALGIAGAQEVAFINGANTHAARHR